MSDSSSSPGQWGPQPGPYGGGQEPEVLSSTGASPLADVTPQAAGGGRRTGRWVAVGVAAAVVAGGGVGALWAAEQLGGGGDQPAAMLPATALGYVAVDFDPSAGQKVGALRFLRKFPELRDRLTEDSDPRQVLVEEIVAQGEVDLDWATDLEPWLGQRVGVAVLPPAAAGEEPVPVVAIQVTDAEQAEAKLRELGDLAPAEEPVGVVVRDGYAIVAETQAQADSAAAAAEDEALADVAAFGSDLEALGGLGVATGWMDLDAVGELLGEQLAEQDLGAALGGMDPTGLLSESYTGRYAFTVRFDGDDLELAVEGNGVAHTEGYAGAGSVDLASLPASTLGALGFAHGEEIVTTQWGVLAEQLATMGMDLDSMAAELEAQYGLAVPDDLATLLGTSFVLAVDSKDVTAMPRVGAVIETDAAEAERILGVVSELLAGVGMPPVATAPADGGLAAASTQSYADELAAGDGGLGDALEGVLPDGDDVDGAFYLDLDGLATVLRDAGATASLSPEDLEWFETLESFDGVGATASSDGEGAVSMRLRVATK